jgi:hypothetical protein
MGVSCHVPMIAGGPAHPQAYEPMAHGGHSLEDMSTALSAAYPHRSNQRPEMGTAQMRLPIGRVCSPAWMTAPALKRVPSLSRRYRSPFALPRWPAAHFDAFTSLESASASSQARSSRSSSSACEAPC